MKSGSLIAVTLLCLVSLSLPGCDDGVSGSSASCRSFCSKLELCDDATDVLGCEQKCNEQSVRSEGYLGVRAQCADKLSCNVFAGEVSVMGEDSCASGELCKLDDCTNNELAKQKLTADQMSYCSRVVTKLNACDHTLDPATLQTHCLDLAPTLSPAYLADVSTCVEGDCSQVVDCLKRTADRYDTALTVLPSALSR